MRRFIGDRFAELGRSPGDYSPALAPSPGPTVPWRPFGDQVLKDDRIRALAIEFGTQWLHVRGFDEFKEKNETLFPTFDANLRSAIYEESILFCQSKKVVLYYIYSSPCI